MSSKQRKVEQRRVRRGKHRREGRVSALRREKNLQSDAHPIYACTVNKEWNELGKATIFIARRTSPGRVTFAAFLVDTWAMGLKDAWGRTDVSCSEFDSHASGCADALEICPLNIGTARHLVYGGIQLARELGFRLPRKYERWTAILGPLPEGEAPDMSSFLVDGKIRLMCSERDFTERLIGTTPEKFLDRPDVEFYLGDDGFTLLDDEPDPSDDALAMLEDAMVERVRQWCFADGQQPHPLLPNVVGATLEAMLQGIPDDFDPDSEIEELPEDDMERMARQTAEFLRASGHHDPAGVDAAVAQLDGFMESCDSSEELWESLRI